MAVIPSESSVRSPVRLRARLVVGGCGLFVLLLEMWLLLSVTDRLIMLTLVAATFVAAVSAFVAGNAHALRDYRRRMGYRTRVLGTRQERLELLRDLPPRQAITQRWVPALAGVALAGAALIATLIHTVGTPLAHVSWIAGLLVLSAAAICYVCGTLVRPAD